MKNWQNKKIVEKLVKCYAAKGVHFDTKKIIPLSDNRFKIGIKVLPDTRVADIKRNARDVQLSLKVAQLTVIEEATAVYIIISPELPEESHHLLNILQAPEFDEAWENMGLAIAVGIDDLGDPVIVDLLDPRCPHAVVCGTTGSGKSVALKSMLITIVSMYSSQEVNLLIGDKANDLAQFTNLPHLSCPPIEDFHTFLSVLLLLKEEMKRRIKVKNTEEFAHFPVIVCVIDEFNSLMGEAPNKLTADLAVATLTQLLRMGRHARIHFILAAHNPTKANMLINTSDLPVKMTFQVSNLHNSVTALGEGGAEKLKGQGDMLFKMNGTTHHVQGAFVSPEEIENILNQVRQQTKRKVAYSPKREQFPRGTHGFTVDKTDLRRIENEIQGEQDSLPCVLTNHRNTQRSTDQLFAKIIEWTLTQKEISCNQISENFNIGWRRANSFIMKLHELGIVGELDAKLPRKVILHSKEELPPKVKDFLRKNDISDISEDMSESLKEF